MKRYITVDGGTTNTRIYLIEDGRIVANAHFPIGARNYGDDKKVLFRLLYSEIEKICLHNGLKSEDIIAVIASGMITSDNGLCPLKHIVAPAGIKELHSGLFKAEFSLYGIPTYFIPGVKMCGERLEEIDIMRGEETEIVGIGAKGEGIVFVLPGSHSKHIYLDGEGRIERFSTMMTGELLAALIESTILHETVGFTDDIPEEAVVDGYEYARARGINEAVFKARILSTVLGASMKTSYGFLLGAVLSSEINSLLYSGASLAILGGKPSLVKPMRLLLERGGMEVKELDDEPAMYASAIGAVRIFEYGD